MATEIKAQIGKMHDKMIAGKMDELLGCYTDDCRILPAGTPMVSGKEGVCIVFACRTDHCLYVLVITMTWSCRFRKTCVKIKHIFSPLMNSIDVVVRFVENVSLTC